MILKVAKAYQLDIGKGVARLDPDALVELQVSPGEVVEIIGKKSVPAIVWRANKHDWGKGYIWIDQFTRQNAEVSIGDKVSVEKANVKSARRVILAPAEGVVVSPLDISEVKRNILHRVILEGNVLPVTFTAGIISQTLPLVVVSTEPKGILKIEEETRVELREKEVKGLAKLGIAYEDIGGLKEEIQRVREMVELPIKHPEIFQRLGVEAPKGVLLHGPPGTGKTLIAKAVATETGASFFSIAGPEIMSRYYGESEQRLREIFEAAKKSSPSIIFIDELDSIAPKREDVSGEVERRVVAQLLAIMDGLEERGQIIVIGATNRINAIDPALRRPGRFDREIELRVPERAERMEILQIHTRNMPLAEDVNLEELASQTHGFVGADLANLCKEAAMKALHRFIPEIEHDFIPREVLQKITVTNQDFKDALREIEPSAMREVLIEIPEVSWDDIGGLSEVKQEIIEAVELPLKEPEKFKSMGISPPHGILLFGPPGTGKTLIAKAVASQTEANFICIRGPELLSKWVGESERAIREIFRRAKQVAPAIIFFDELDAIAPMRGLEEGSRVSERVVNQLLSELDGMERLENVIVIAATNRPDILDPALIRPGRFDRLLLVGLPSKSDRKEIFRIHTRKMPLSNDVVLDELVEKTENYAGSDIETLCREAALFALRKGKMEVGMEEFLSAMEKVKPTITENMMRYYERVRETLAGRVDIEGYR